MAATERFDSILIGSGQAANPLASALSASGRKVALIERTHVGGTCINEGCTPTKTMVASARVAYLARRGADYGVETSDLRMNLERVRERKRAIVERFRGGNQKRLESDPKISLIFGEGSFVDAKTVRVKTADGERLLTAGEIFINTGTRRALPELTGLSDVPFLDNVSIMELDAVPEHLIVMGGGYIGVEFSQMFRRFGSRVSIVHNGPRLLAHEDADIADAVRDVLKEEGIDLYFNAHAQRVRNDAGKVTLTMDIADDASAVHSREIEGSHLLLATGRVPNSDALNPAAAGVATDDHGYIRVNERLETNVPGVYALGDVKGGPAFTHISFDDFRIIRANLIDGKSASTAGRMVPYTIFIDPQLGRIGLTEHEAREQKLAIRVAKMPMSHVARALETDETRGLMKVIVDAASERILGAAVLGIEGGEIASLIQVAMMGGLKYTVLKDAVFSHPTLAESLNNLFQKFED